MNSTRFFGRVWQFMSVSANNPELLRAQLAALSRMIPLLYFILVANACVLTITFLGKAPNWLNLYVALALSAVCAVRLVQWWRRRGVEFTDEEAAHELRRTNRLAGILGVAFSVWVIALFPYGDVYAQAHVGTFLTVAMLSSMLCLIHLRSAALIIALTVCVPATLFLATRGIPTFLGTAINILLVTAAVAIVILIQYRDFTRMVEAQRRTEILSNENLRLANLDSLTSLPNRRAFFTHLDKAFACAQAQGTRLALAENIAASLREPCQLPGAMVQISGSVGMAVYPEMAITAEQLFERADYALYHGKAANRGRGSLFSAEHEAKINSDATIEQTLRTADIEQELSVVFQPIVDIRSQRTIGFEALARWTNPALGNISPGRFIPVAERAGIVGMLTRPLLRKALTEAAQWSADLRLSFNLSAHDLNSAEGALAILSIIEASSFEAGRLDLEITETAFMHDFAQVERSIEMLRLLGCGISLDDFGTGYSSLARLHALPLTKIKIDRSFVTGLHKSPTGLKIVKSLLALSRDMGLDCVVEGVETQEEMTAVRGLGGLMVQGYFYSPPITPDRVSAYLNSEAATALRA